jgi:hypothetical protein
MKPKCSLPFSQEQTTGPCPEPDEYSPHLATPHFTNDPSNTIFPLCLGLQSSILFACLSYWSYACYMPHPSHYPWFYHTDPVVHFLNIQTYSYRINIDIDITMQKRRNDFSYYVVKYSAHGKCFTYKSHMTVLLRTISYVVYKPPLNYQVLR